MRYSIDFAKWKDYPLFREDDPTSCVHEISTSMHLSRFHEQEYDNLFLQKEIAVLREILLNHPRFVFVHKPCRGESLLTIGHSENVKLRGIPVDFGMTKNEVEQLTQSMVILDETNTSIFAVHDIALNLRHDGFRILYFVVDEMSHAIHQLIRKHTIDTFLDENA